MREKTSSVADADRSAPERRRAPVPQDLPGRLLASRFGSLITRPWFDRLVLQVGLAAYIPLSRAWAAAAEADGDLARFIADVPLARVPPSMERGLRRSLRRVAELRADHDAMNREWEHTFFGPSAAGPERLVLIERARRRASDSFMKGRLAFLPLRLRGALPSVRFELPRPSEVEARHGPRLANIPAAYLPPAIPCRRSGSRGASMACMRSNTGCTIRAAIPQWASSRGPMCSSPSASRTRRA